ncbi:MAG: 2-amino-3-ketobutyrate coenzyme ligase [Sphingomonadales bacterium]|nr:2-amino-3-ketobutyrate coenzyme ligase [Sphingomonadales bacterium]
MIDTKSMGEASDTGFYAAIANQLADITSRNLLKQELEIFTPQGSRVEVRSGEAARDLINFCSNNYLGLSNHPRIVAAAHAGLERWGFGMSSVRFICGTQHIHKELERRISAFAGFEDTILFSSCFDANTGFFEAFLDENDQIISDRLNHASIIDGIRLCKARRAVYDNCDLGQLEQKLRDASGARHRIIVTDGVFSMDGLVAPLAGICDLAERYGALVYVDDSHGIGAIGASGRGAIEHHGVRGRVDFLAGTLGKALGGASGGFVCGRGGAIELMRQKARPYLFSNSLAPALVTAAIEAFDILEDEPERLSRLAANARLLREGLTEAGYTLLGADHAILPVAIGDAGLNARLAEAVLQRGFYVTPFSYPVVPDGAARIRLQVSAAHSEEDLQLVLSAFRQAGAELGILG